MERVEFHNHADQHTIDGHTTPDITDLIGRLAENEKSEKRHQSDSAALTRIIAATLLAMNKTMSDLEARVANLQAGIQEQASRKDWYSVAEAAKELGKAAFTVREWCRLNRIRAHRRECGRGGKREWMISREEIERIRNKGLLPANL